MNLIKQKSEYIWCWKLLANLLFRRANTENKEKTFLIYTEGSNSLLPNTSKRARNAEEAGEIVMRLQPRDGMCGDFKDCEIMHDAKHLLSDNYETVKANWKTVMKTVL